MLVKIPVSTLKSPWNTPLSARWLTFSPAAPKVVYTSKSGMHTTSDCGGPVVLIALGGAYRENENTVSNPEYYFAQNGVQSQTNLSPGSVHHLKANNPPYEFFEKK